MLIKSFKQIAVCGLFIATIASCKKEKEIDEVYGSGETLIKVINGGPTDEPGTPLIGIDFVSTPQSTVLFDVRRDVPNNAALNTTQTVTVKVDTAMLRIVNDTIVAHGGQPYQVMPESWYSTNPDITWGGTFELTFAPGEFAKEIEITVPDASLFDPSATYAFPFTLVSANPDETISSERSVIRLIGAKNIYDGVYTVVSGLVTRYTAPGVPAGDALSGPLAGNPDVYLITTGANTVRIPPSGSEGGLFWAAGSNSMVAGIDNFILSVDPSSNLTSVTPTAATNATFANWAGKPNYYDPATKTFYLAWRWNPTSTTREYEIVLKYKQPR